MARQESRHCDRWSVPTVEPILTKIREEVRASCSAQVAAPRYVKAESSAASAALPCRALVHAVDRPYPLRTVSVPNAVLALWLEASFRRHPRRSGRPRPPRPTPLRNAANSPATSRVGSRRSIKREPRHSWDGRRSSNCCCAGGSRLSVARVASCYYLLQPRYRLSSLLRIGPPQCSASVLSPRGAHRLCFSLNIIRALVPAVPRESLHPVHAPSTPVAVCPVIRHPTDLSQKRFMPLVLTTLVS